MSVHRRHAEEDPRDGPGTRSVPRVFFLVFSAGWTRRFGELHEGGAAFRLGGDKNWAGHAFGPEMKVGVAALGRG